MLVNAVLIGIEADFGGEEPDFFVAPLLITHITHIYKYKSHIINIYKSYIYMYLNKIECCQAANLVFLIIYMGELVLRFATFGSGVFSDPLTVLVRA